MVVERQDRNPSAPYRRYPDRAAAFVAPPNTLIRSIRMLCWSERSGKQVPGSRSYLRYRVMLPAHRLISVEAVCSRTRPGLYAKSLRGSSFHAQSVRWGGLAFAGDELTKGKGPPTVIYLAGRAEAPAQGHGARRSLVLNVPI